MKTKINEEIYEEANTEFYEEYQTLLISRMIHSSMSLETDLGNTDDSKNALKYNDYMIAFKRLLNLLPLNLSLDEDIVKNIANKINESSLYISNDYRKSGKFLADTNIPIADPNNIESELKNLFFKYENEWQDMDIFEREAKFHIDFIRIHPFEDGNGRTSRAILNYNILKEGYAPIIITDDLLDYYYSYIANDDIENMARLFKIQSSKENKIINTLFDKYKKENLELGNATVNIK